LRITPSASAMSARTHAQSATAIWISNVAMPRNGLITKSRTATVQIA
jgi:hypothetical protein